MDMRKEKLNGIQYMVEQLTDPLFNTLVLQSTQQNVDQSCPISYIRLSSMPIPECGK